MYGGSHHYWRTIDRDTSGRVAADRSDRSGVGDPLGVVIVVVVLMSPRKASIRPSPVAKFVGGSVSGLFATTAAIGGPPVAILYQDRPGPEVRSMLAVLVAVGSALSLVESGGSTSCSDSLCSFQQPSASRSADHWGSS